VAQRHVGPADLPSVRRHICRATSASVSDHPATQRRGQAQLRKPGSCRSWVPAIGHNRSYRQQKDRIATVRFTRYCGHRPSTARGVKIPKAAARSLSMPKTRRPSAAHDVELALPTHGGRRVVEMDRPRAVMSTGDRDYPRPQNVCTIGATSGQPRKLSGMPLERQHLHRQGLFHPGSRTCPSQLQFELLVVPMRPALGCNSRPTFAQRRRVHSVCAGE
jgi:hypothetical protein